MEQLNRESDRLYGFYKTLCTIRHFDERVRDIRAAKQLPGYAHTYFGSEAIAAGVMGALAPGDWIASTYRCHGHAIAKGVSLQAMAAEILGRVGGVCKGKGGSMHVSDFDCGMLGSFGIVAAGIPIALGAALSSQYQGRSDIAVAFFGDGAVHQGVFHEGVGLSRLWNAPLVLVCENNQYAEATAIEYHLNTKTIADMACAYNLPAARADGMDVVTAYEAARTAVERARSGGGPTLLELVSYRFSGQYEGDKQEYQPPEEIAQARKRDPLVLFQQQAAARGLDDAELQRIDAEAVRAVEEAWESAFAAPFPDAAEALEDVYTTYEQSNG